MKGRTDEDVLHARAPDAAGLQRVRACGRFHPPVGPVAGASNGNDNSNGKSQGNPPAHAADDKPAAPQAKSNESSRGAAASNAKADNRSDGASERSNDQARQSRGQSEERRQDKAKAQQAEAEEKRGNQAEGPRNEARDENRGNNGRSQTADAPRPNNGAANPESPGASGEHKQTICHRTRSATNPYVVITVDFHAVDGEIVDSDGDHAERHRGPVFEPVTMSNGDAWGDIIPPFTTQDGAEYPGSDNWGEGGEAIFDGVCQVGPPAEEPSAVDEDDGDGDGDGDGNGNNGNQTDVDGDDQGTDVEGDAEENGDNGENGGAAGDGGGTDRTVTAEEDVFDFGGAEVLGDQVVRDLAVASDQAVPASVSALPRTGNDTGLLAGLGAALVAMGFVLRRTDRRRTVLSG